MTLRSLTGPRWTWLLSLLVGTSCQTPPIRQAADLVLRDGIVFGAAGEESTSSALAVVGNKIAEVGSDAAIRKWIGSATRVIELEGRLVTPGINDAHLHFGPGGVTLLRVQLLGTTSVDEIETRVRAAAEAASPGEWIQGRGWDHTLLPPEQLGPDGWPRREALDRAAPDNPVFLQRVDGHTGWVNSNALGRLGYDLQTRDPPGGRLVRESGSGRLTGILVESAVDSVEARIGAPTVAMKRRGIAASLELAARTGVTSVTTEADAEDIRIFRQLLSSGELTVRIYAWRPLTRENIAAYAAEGVTQATGSPWLRTGILKGYTDGSLGSRSAWMLEPFSDDPSTRGVRRYGEGELEALVAAADSAHLQVMLHAIGDAGNRAALDAFESVSTADDHSRRHRIEHAQILDPADIGRFAKIGVVASMQPTHATSDMRWVEDRIGAERAQAGAYAWRSLLDAGARLAFGTDFVVEPMAPIEGLYSAVTRRSRDEQAMPPGGWLPEQRLTMEEAIRSYTAGSAYAEFQEDIKGTLEEGMLADLVVWDRNLLSTPAEELLRAAPDLTLVDGKIVFERS